jgi:hypothetical protein
MNKINCLYPFICINILCATYPIKIGKYNIRFKQPKSINDLKKTLAFFVFSKLGTSVEKYPYYSPLNAFKV